MEIRPYQEKIINQARSFVAGGARNILIQLLTGGGKTVLASEIIKSCLAKGNRAIFLCHTQEILFQTEATLRRFGVEASIMISGEPYDPTNRCIVASIMTFHSWVMRRKKEAMPKADVVFFDEAHGMSGSRVWQAIHAAYPNAVIFGLTATPITRVGKGLGAYFDRIILGPSYSQAFEDGWLVPPKYYVPSVPDLDGVKKSMGDYVQNQLQEKMDKPKLIGDIIQNWTNIAKGRPTIVYCSGIKHSINVSEQFNNIGVSAAHIDGDTPSDERKKIIDDFKAGKIKVLCNALVFTVGTDLPLASCIVIARPTKSLLLYLQMIGRGLRPYDGKENCTVIDHAGCYYEHGPIDQDWDWKLEYRETDKDLREQRKKSALKKEITCRNCKTVFTGKIVCPECGTRVERNGKHYETFEAYLQAIDEIERPDPAFGISQRDWYLQLRRNSEIRKYSVGWADHAYKEKFGHWPKRKWKGEISQDISLPVMSYIESKSQAYRASLRRDWYFKRNGGKWK